MFPAEARIPSGSARARADQPAVSRFLALPSRRRLAAWAIAISVLAVGVPRLQRENLFSEGGETQAALPLPEIPTASGDWIGTAPMTNADLRGRIWVLKVWTFGCVNCIRSIPFTNKLLERFGSDVGVLGIHSPEFDWERDKNQLARALQEHGVRFPTYVDQSLDYFMALEAPGWPVWYVVDRQTRIRGRWFGEVHEGTMRERAMTALIERLLEEPERSPVDGSRP